MKVAVTALLYKGEIFNSDILMVSRKDNHNLFGLPGGKVDDDDSDNIKAMIREVKEETGIDVLEALPFYFREEGEYLSLTYLITSYDGNINTKEAGIVKFDNIDILKSGAFPVYNTDLINYINYIKNV